MGIRDKFAKKRGDEWVDWLADEQGPVVSRQDHASEPEAQVRVHQALVSDAVRRERLRNAGGHHANLIPQDPKQAHGGAASRVIEINLNLPKVRLPHPRIKVAQIRYWAAFGVIVITVSIGVRAGIGVLVPAHKTGTSVDVKGASTSTPTFKPLVPNDKKDLANSNGTTSKYIPDRQLYTYLDTYLGAQVTVSEQPAPENLVKNSDELAKLAASIGAKDKVDTAFGPAYIATSQNGTSQRVVTVQRGLLIFIETIKKYDNDAWKLYIENLR